MSFSFTKIKYYLALIILIILGGLLIYANQIIYGVLLILISLVVFYVWKQIIGVKDEKIEQLQGQIKNNQSLVTNLTKEVEELSNRKLNITDIRQILELGLIEVDTKFIRIVEEEVPHDEKNVKFIGALQVDMVMKYGIDLRELRFKHDPKNNEISVGNIRPKFLSFSKRRCIWRIAQIMEEKKLKFIGSDHWKTNDELEKIANDIKERYRLKTEQEVENGPEELQWLIEPLRKQIHGALQLLLGANGRTVKFVENPDSNYKALEDLNEI